MFVGLGVGALAANSAVVVGIIRVHKLQRSGYASKALIRRAALFGSVAGGARRPVVSDCSLHARRGRAFLRLSFQLYYAEQSCPYLSYGLVGRHWGTTCSSLGYPITIAYHNGRRPAIQVSLNRTEANA